jgi:hypothetical protein
LTTISFITKIINQYNSVKFYSFENKIHSSTWRNRQTIIDWANQCIVEKERYEDIQKYKNSNDEIARQGFELANKIKQQFKDKYKDLPRVRILVNVPSAIHSPGGYSLFSNMVSSLLFLGVPTRTLSWDESINEHLMNFKPTILMTSDDKSYLDKIDWHAVNDYREKHLLKVGLTASLEEYGNTNLIRRLAWAKRHGVSFYYNFRTPAYLHTRAEYKPFYHEGYQIYSIEFGANPLLYYPLPDIKKDLNYVFLASSNRMKWERYFRYLSKLFAVYPGFIDGPGWSHARNYQFSSDRDRYIYARAKIGINLHLDEQLEWANELNERTYMLAACGVPQLIDNPKLLSEYFSGDSMFIATTPQEYKDLFEYILSHENEARERALKAQRIVFQKHTTFHRLDNFIPILANMVKE